jgi:hypothetical protein
MGNRGNGNNKKAMTQHFTKKGAKTVGSVMFASECFHFVENFCFDFFLKIFFRFSFEAQQPLELRRKCLQFLLRSGGFTKCGWGGVATRDF